MRSRSFIVIVLITVLMLVVPLKIVLANSLPPPEEIWFVVETQEADGLDLQGAQLWGCSDEACRQPVLILQWESCTDRACVFRPSKEMDTITRRLGGLECISTSRKSALCRSAGYNFGYPYFRLALQRTNQLAVQAESLPLEPEAYPNWHLAARGEVLVATRLEKQPNQVPLPPFFIYFGITLLVELGFAGVYAVWRWRLGLKDTLKRISILLLINLLTYPVIWFFFPSLARFHESGVLKFGIEILVFTLLLAGIYWMIANSVSKTVAYISMFWGGVLTLFSPLIVVGLGADALFLGENQIVAAGLPIMVILVLSEVYAVVVEAVLLHGFTGRKVSLPEAGLLSLGLNAASVVVGLLVAW